ncbi:hypothetical protein ACN42_g2347 [Penicillium freii]|uniref:Uncharacterized protein n=1 Tax=Penicillium freii TaxID=48697 RepID=A0A101MQC7_PENFR|nr:hypothetical protein ACN42_g2347 [Penicillium freii]
MNRAEAVFASDCTQRLTSLPGRSRNRLDQPVHTQSLFPGPTAKALANFIIELRQKIEGAARCMHAHGVRGIYGASSWVVDLVAREPLPPYLHRFPPGGPCPTSQLNNPAHFSPSDLRTTHYLTSISSTATIILNTNLQLTAYDKMNRVQCLQQSFQESSHEAGAWNLSTEIELDITTLAAICQVRHQQRAPLRTNVDGDVNSAESAGDEQMHVDRQLLSLYGNSRLLG